MFFGYHAEAGEDKVTQSRNLNYTLEARIQDALTTHVQRRVLITAQKHEQRTQNLKCIFQFLEFPRISPQRKPHTRLSRTL